MTVLVAAASKHGATDELAERIGADLAERGLDVDVKKLEELADLGGYEAFVLGSAVYLGNWLTCGVRDDVATTGTRVVAAVVVLLLVAAVMVVLARVGSWQQAFVSDRVIRFFAWALAAVFLVETLAAFTWSSSEELWWMYGPVSLVIAALALVVAGSGSAWPRFHRPHRMRPSH